MRLRWDNEATQMMYRVYWPIAVKLPAYVSKNNEKLEKGTGILQTVSVAEYNEPAWDTRVVDMKLKKRNPA